MYKRHDRSTKHTEKKSAESTRIRTLEPWGDAYSTHPASTVKQLAKLIVDHFDLTHGCLQ